MKGTKQEVHPLAAVRKQSMHNFLLPCLRSPIRQCDALLCLNMVE